MRAGFWTLLAIFAVCVAQRPAHACSVGGGYKVPNAFGLIDAADAIVLARVEKRIDDMPFGVGTVRLRPEAIIAGNTLPSELLVDAILATPDQPPTLSDPHNLVAPNPESLSGSCNRYILSEGMLLLVFAQRDKKGHWLVINPPFSRGLEDVSGPDALWVRAVRFYASVAKMPESRWQRVMKAEHDRLLAAGQREDVLLAQDIDRYLERQHAHQ